MNDEFSQLPLSQKGQPTLKYVWEREKYKSVFGENEPHFRQQFPKPESL